MAELGKSQKRKIEIPKWLKNIKNKDEGVQEIIDSSKHEHIPSSEITETVLTEGQPQNINNSSIQ